MAIEKWHYGKLAICWGWTILLVLLAVKGLEGLAGSSLSEGLRVFSKFALLVLMAGLLIGASVVTWKWLTGKERDPNRNIR